MLDNLNKAIGSPDSAWHEHNVETTTDILDNIKDKEWENFVTLIKAKPTFWQIRCAEALSLSERDRCLSLLADLLINTEEKEVALIAACTIEDSDYDLDTNLGYEKPLELLLSKMNKLCETRYEDVENLLKKIKRRSTGKN